MRISELVYLYLSNSILASKPYRINLSNIACKRRGKKEPERELDSYRDCEDDKRLHLFIVTFRKFIASKLIIL